MCWQFFLKNLQWQHVWSFLFAHAMLQRPTVSQSGPSKLPRSDHNSIIAKGIAKAQPLSCFFICFFVRCMSRVLPEILGFFEACEIQCQLHCCPLLLSCGCALAKKLTWSRRWEELNVFWRLRCLKILFHHLHMFYVQSIKPYILLSIYIQLLPDIHFLEEEPKRNLKCEALLNQYCLPMILVKKVIHKKRRLSLLQQMQCRCLVDFSCIYIYHESKSRYMKLDYFQ